MLKKIIEKIKTRKKEAAEKKAREEKNQTEILISCLQKKMEGGTRIYMSATDKQDQRERAAAGEMEKRGLVMFLLRDEQTWIIKASEAHKN